MLWSKCIATNNNENELKHNVMLNVCTYKSGTSESPSSSGGADAKALGLGPSQPELAETS